MAFLSDLIRLNHVTSMVDFGCGFWSVMKDLDLSAVEYTGVDVAELVIAHNREKAAAPNRHFLHLTSLDQLPPADLLFSKHVLQHLPNADVQRYLATFRRKYKYIILGNDRAPAENLNGDIAPGGYRALDLTAAPFHQKAVTFQRWQGVYFGVPTVTDFVLLM